MSTVVELHFDSARKFIDHLRRGNDHWWNKSTGELEWVFRGQWNSRWLLEPRAWRAQAGAGFERLREKISQLHVPFLNLTDLQKRYVIQLNTEVEALGQFAELCDEHAFDVAQLEDQYRPLFLGHLSTQLRSELPESAYHVAAVAQHHGIPTRLIDWSYDPLVAAFFAVEHSFRDASNPVKIAVFALHRDNLTRWNMLGRTPKNTTRTRMFQGRRARNEYLRSQSGCFVAILEPEVFEQANQCRPDLESLLRWVQQPDSRYCPVVQKMTLDSLHADELLFLIDREGVSRASLMPSLDNVASTLRNRWEYLAK